MLSSVAIPLARNLNSFRALTELDLLARDVTAVGDWPSLLALKR